MTATGPDRSSRMLSRRTLLGALLGGALILACSRFRRDEEEPPEVAAATPTPSPSATPAATAPATATPTPTPTRTPIPTPTRTPTPTPTPDPTPVTPTPYPSTLDPDDLRGFIVPVEGGCLPASDRLMPNAPREYRNGFHEGIDWYDGLACARVFEGTPVLAMHRGIVIRADLDYVEITIEQIAEFSRRTADQGYTDEPTLDIYRGRQIWIDHGNGVVTRYAHLGEIAEGIEEGVEVEQGQVIGGVGESGTPEAITAPGTEMHLHAEVRIEDSFLGDGLPPGEVRALYRKLYGLGEDGEDGGDGGDEDDEDGDDEDGDGDGRGG